ncbi:MAG: hypothetical protein IKX24_07345 [Prevotella sp.]|nr:hypothetical protein [Prevotella sp.]
MKANYSKPICRELSATTNETLLLSSVHTGGDGTGGTGGGRQGVKPYDNRPNDSMWDL